MECAHYREQITRHIDRPLSPDVRMHIGQCPACQHHYEEEKTMFAMSNVALAPFRLQGSLSDKILRRLPEAEELDDLPTPGSRILWWGASLAAAAAMVVVGLFAFSPEQGPLPPENDSGKVHNGTTPAGTPQDEPKYEEQCIVIADVVAVDDQRVQVRIATVLRGDSLTYRTGVGERMETHNVQIQNPDGTFSDVVKTVPVTLYEYRKRSLTGATISFATANARTIGFHQFTAGEKIVMTFPNLPPATIENDTIALPEKSVSRLFTWSATREKEIRDEIARGDEWLVTEMYDVTNLNVRLGAVEKIVELVKKSVAPDSWTKPGRSIKAENGVLTISQVRSVHRKIQEYLALKRAEAAPAESAVGGKVVSYSPELGAVVLDVGSDNGVREGVEFTISREKTEVASGIAMKVDARLTVVQVKNKVADPLPGDGCRATEHASPKAYPNATILVKDSTSEIVARVKSDGITLIVETKSDVILWEKKVGSEGGVIRHLAIRDGQITATIGKHTFVTLDLRTGEELGVGSDKPVPHRQSLDLSTPEKAWAAFVEALKSGDEARIKAVTTERGRGSIKGYLMTDKDKEGLTKRVLSWTMAEDTAKGSDGNIEIQLIRTSKGWQLDNLDFPPRPS